MATTSTKGFTLMMLFIAHLTNVESLALQDITIKYTVKSECGAITVTPGAVLCDSPPVNTPRKCYTHADKCDDGLFFDGSKNRPSMGIVGICVKTDALGRVISRCEERWCKVPNFCPTNQIRDLFTCKCVDASQATTTTSVGCEQRTEIVAFGECIHHIPGAKICNHNSTGCTCSSQESTCADGLRGLDRMGRCVKKDALGRVISRCDDCKFLWEVVCPTNHYRDFVQCKCVDASQATTTTSVPQNTTRNVTSALEMSSVLREDKNKTKATAGRTTESNDIPVPTTSHATIQTITSASMLATVIVVLTVL